jgi:hypothetical protein
MPREDQKVLPATEIARLFRQRRARRFVVPGILIILWAASVLLFPPRQNAHLPTPVAVLAVTVVLFGVFFTFRNWRCPNCNRFLGQGLRTPRFCPNCGVALQ